jgi:oxygen-independent coproporphyrinogen-3 oxidase
MEGMLATPSLAPEAARQAPLSEALLRRFDTPGPRYTSYPTADRFGDHFGPADAAAALTRLALTAPATTGPISVYVHIPFCESLCYYCACNKIITRHHERAAAYLDLLEAEMQMVAERLGRHRRVSQLHFGGGSPTFLSDAELARLVGSLEQVFELSADVEMSIEVDPRTVTPQRLAALRVLGFNRLSFGVQDFDADVQRAVHRVQPFDSVRVLIEAARALGFGSINADLIYGLPKQTASSFERTLRQVCELKPERIALYAYAHLPTVFKPQRRILADDLPGPAERTRMLAAAIGAFLSDGYEYIGMDHFARADDALAIAKREGRLQRNFQGYSTHKDCDLIGLGASAISRVAGTYYQNAKALPEYDAAIGRGHLPVVRGVALTADDSVRRAAIMDLMCQGRLEFDALDDAFGIDARSYFDAELQRLRSFADAGLVTLDADGVVVSDKGWYVIRAIAMVFDAYLPASAQAGRFSRVV